MSAPTISVIVPCRDAARTLPRALAALAHQRLGEPYEVIVVDDGSSDGSAEIAEAGPGQVRVLRRPAEGPGPARNRGAAAARGELLAFTDADCEPQPDWLAAGLQALDRADLVQGAVRPDPQATPGPFDRSLWVDHETLLYETANLFVRRRLFEELGGFEGWIEPRAGKPLAEDVWLGWRARRAGAVTAFCADAVVHHAVIPRGPVEMIAERRRLRHFPDIVAEIPELRDSRLYLRIFLAPRTAAFDLALASLAAAAASRSPFPAVGIVPYGAHLLKRSIGWRGRAPQVAAALAVADAIGLWALLGGSIRRRTVVI